ncbi:AbiV family abortive infection protein [Radiobacillus kanasensis]|uniref:AbiV family abortive infection protein n=1 Tax=Radiobacillus kanasensis TaxID=2844358 RepID=UPI001E427DC6|nr:AbiV family abortive infection protein [Radiobacillus kanasensis]UFU00165.1 AbiV family abortive infection protein [Radiobacillus kanasensis]
MTALSFQKLEEAYNLVYENTKELLVDSRLLLENERYARSYALAQMAHEELAKLPIIYQEATRSYFKETHDWKSFYKRLRNHGAKNKQNFVFYQTMLNAVGNNSMNLEYEKIKDNLAFVNHMKNISLYADIKNDKFTKPSNEINEKLAVAQLELAEEMFKTYSLSGFHIKGGIKKSLDNEDARKNRTLLKEAGLIK